MKEYIVSDIELNTLLRIVQITKEFSEEGISDLEGVPAQTEDSLLQIKSNLNLCEKIIKKLMDSSEY